MTRRMACTTTTMRAWTTGSPGRRGGWPSWTTTTKRETTMNERCEDHLIEPDWLEGFRCSLSAGHPGPHRDTSDWDTRNESTSATGRPYLWVYEWIYADSPQMEALTISDNDII